MKNFIIVFSLLCCIRPARSDVFDTMNSVCMVKTGSGAISSGFAFREDAENFYILTAGHGVIAEPRVFVAFFVDGKATPMIEVDSVNASFNDAMKDFEQSQVRDCALLKLPKSKLGKEQYPTCLKLAKTNPKMGDKLSCVGCANGAWPTLITGSVSGYGYRGNQTFEFVPRIEQGRSGGPVLNSKFEVVGMAMMWHYAGHSSALSIEALREHGFKLDE